MRQLCLILDAARQLAARGEEGVLATVVKVEGSTYRRPGARLLVSRDGSVGGVSGGCLEGDLVRKAWWRTEGGPVVVAYDSRADAETAWQLGLGCNGVVHVLLERLGPAGPDPLGLARRCVAANERGVLATVIRADPATGAAVGDRLTLGPGGVCEGDLGNDELTNRARADAAYWLARDRGRAEVYELTGGEAEVAFEVVRPPVRLLVFGAGADAASLVDAAKALGWHVTVVDRRSGASHRPVFAAADAFLVAPARIACEQLRPDARTAAVVMNHSFPDDRDAVAALLSSPCRYVGVLGPRARTEKILGELPDPEPGQLNRLYAPVGLDVGADGPEEIAVAVTAEVLALFTGRSGGHLRDRPGPIHRRESVRPIEALS